MTDDALTIANKWCNGFGLWPGRGLEEAVGQLIPAGKEKIRHEYGSTSPLNTPTCKSITHTCSHKHPVSRRSSARCSHLIHGSTEAHKPSDQSDQRQFYGNTAKNSWSLQGLRGRFVAHTASQKQDRLLDHLQGTIDVLPYCNYNSIIIAGHQGWPHVLMPHGKCLY